MGWKFERTTDLRLFVAHLRDEAHKRNLADLAAELDDLASGPFLQGEFLAMARAKMEEIRPLVRREFSRAHSKALDEAVWAIHRAQFPD